MRSPDDFLQDIEDHENGRFLVEEREQQAYLTVYPAGRKGKAVRLADVLARLDLFGIRYSDRAAIEEIVEGADGKSYAVGIWRGPAAVDAVLQVEISEDEMFAWVEAAPPQFGGSLPSVEQIEQILRQAGVVAGIDGDALARIASGEVWRPRTEAADPGRAPGNALQEIYQHPERVRVEAARGKHPTPGRPAKVHYLFNPHPRAAPEASPGRVDFRKLNVVQTCRSGDLLAEMQAGESGAPGFTVRGQSIAPPNNAEPGFVAGSNVELDSKGRAVYARIDGHVRVDEPEGLQPRISVEPVLELENVDYSVGNIDYPGTVRVLGTVFDGFEVRAAGDILVENTVGNVKLTAEGDIALAGGAFCRGAGMIRAGGDVYARFVQDGNVSAGRSVFIEEAAINSRISAGIDVQALGGRGELIGGNILAGRKVHCVKLGVRSEALTQISAGIAPEEMEKIQALQAELTEAEAVLRRAENHLQQIRELKKRGRALSDKDQETKLKLETICQRYRAAVRNLEEQRKRLLATISPAPGAEVVAEEEIYPGVEVDFGAGIRRYRLEGAPVAGGGKFLLVDGRIILRRREF